MADCFLTNNPLFFDTAKCPCCSFLSHADLFLPLDSSSIEKVEEDEEKGSMLSPHDALEQIMMAASSSSQEEGTEKNKGEEATTPPTRVLLIDTHGHPHLNRERQAEYISSSEKKVNNNNNNLIALSCAVSQSDWITTLNYASTSKHILPGLGVHPWYLDSLSPNYLQDLEMLLKQHPNAIVGEIGLCKVAKFIRTYPDGKTAALTLQRKVFQEQLQLAAKLKRPTSVHCVKSHGVLLSILKEMKEKAKLELKEIRKKKKNGGGGGGGNEINESDFVRSAFPPAIGMHSFTGTAHHVKELLAFEESLYGHDTNESSKKKKKQQKKKDANIQQNNEAGVNEETTLIIQNKNNTNGEPSLEQPPPPLPEQRKPQPLFYFGFSHSINVLMCSSDKSRKQTSEAIRAVPLHRVLAESDVHSHEDVAAATAGAIANIAFCMDMPIVDVAKLTARNGLLFFGSLWQSDYIIKDTGGGVVS
uniref:TatD related DNase n=1 Tax=Ditylum brightwellii TaxID=49249 RepID=A0A7S4RPG0_9STRA